MEILSKFWPYGSCAILCKMIAMLQALSIFVSTISITAIAFDRYQVSTHTHTHTQSYHIPLMCFYVCYFKSNDRHDYNRILMKLKVFFYIHLMMLKFVTFFAKVIQI